MAAIIFLLTYLGVAIGRIPALTIDRTGIALLGAVAMVLFGGLTPAGALDAVHLPTLLLLYGLMIVSAQLRLGGFYTWLALKVTTWIDRPARFLFLLMAVSGLLSSVLANDIICLAFTPVICVALRKRQLNPLPFLLGLAMATNLGSASTIIGNPQSMLIGQLFDLNFTRFLFWCAPPSLLGLLATYGILLLMFRKTWRIPGENGEAIEGTWPSFQPWQSAKGLAATLVVVALLLLDQPRTLSVLVVAGVLLLSRRMHTRPMLALVDWHLITLFTGLFIVVRGFHLTGLPEAALARMAANGLDLHNPYWLGGITVLLSNLVSNVPATLLLVNPLHGAPDELAYVLSLASTYAGNLLTIGSLANLIVIEQAKTHGIRIRFLDYAKAGVPVTAVNLLILFAWVALKR